MNRYLGEKCKNHPILDADGRCATCWGYFCDACLEDIGNHRYCEECAPSAVEKYNAKQQVTVEERKRLDMRLLLYTLVLLLAVIIGGWIVYSMGGIDQYFGNYIASYQVLSKPISLGSKLNGFEVAKTNNFNIFYHSADFANVVIVNVEDHFNKILGDTLIYKKDVMARGKFNIIIVADNNELQKLFPDVLTNRAALTDYETKSIVLVEANETGNVQIDLTHELAHAIFFERMRSGNKIPNWLHEGLSSFEEAKFDSTQIDARWATFGPDIVQGGGLPLNQLVLTDNTGPEEVNLFYAESYSVVAYMINTYGMDKFVKMAAQIQNGGETNKVINDVYKPDLTGLSDLERKWRESLG
ncbi:MAG: peptidase MA family metallohydrolase [Actinomycetota bacterium]